MTQISVASFNKLTPLWTYGGATCTLKLYYTRQFIDSLGNVVLRGDLENPHQTITCSIASGIITIPPVTLKSTEDGTPSNSSLTGVFFDTNGIKRTTFFSKYRIPISTPTTWTAIFLHNQASVVLPDEYYTRVQTELLINDEIGDALVSFVTLFNTYGNSLPDAIAEIGSTNTTLIVDQSTVLDEAITIPANLVLDIRSGATIKNGGSGSIAFAGLGLLNPTNPVPVFEDFADGEIVWNGLQWPPRISIELWETGNDSLNERINLADAAVATLSDTFVAGDVNTTTNIITLTGHPFETGMMVVPSTTGTFPTTSPADYLYADIPVYIIKVDANSVKLAYTYDEAFAGTAIDLTNGGSGTHTLSKYTATTLICHPRTITNPGSTISEFHTLLFTEGNYQSEFSTWGTTYFAAFELKDNTTMTADGHAVLCESPVDGNGNFVLASHMRYGAGTSDKSCKNIVVEKLHFLGNPNQIEISGGHAAVLLGNCTNSFIRFNTFERLKAYAAGLGAGGAEGNYARDSGIHNNMFIGCEAQNAFILNGDSCFVSHNYFDLRGAAGGAVIDIEPNSEADVANNILVENNVIDASKSSGSWGGIAMQCAGALTMQGGICRNNAILGRDISDAAGYGALASGILFAGNNAGVIANNFIRAASSRGVQLWGCRNIEVGNNQLFHCVDGSGNDASLDLLDSNACHIYNNVNTQSEIMPFAASTAISESDVVYPATSTGSVILANPVGGYRLYTHQVGLQVLFNATLYTISDVSLSPPYSLTVTVAPGTVGVASVASATDVDTGTSRITETAHPYNDDCRLLYTEGTVAIGGLVTNTEYYVVNKTANNFQLAATPGGAFIPLTTTGTGTQTFSPRMQARFSANTYYGNDAAKGYILSTTGTSEITSTARDRLVTTVADVNHTATTASGIILYTSLTAGRTVNLPDATRCKGKEIVVKDGAGAAAANNITLDGNGTQTIDGAATYAIATNWGRVAVKSNGANWNVIG